MKINLLLTLAFLSFIGYANIDYLHGIVGMTLKDGGIGCLCHDFSQSDTVTVWIEGPDSIIRNTSQQYKLLMTGGPAAAGGFNIASNIGILDAVDTLTRVLSGELTHTSPNPFINDTVFWNFSYTAPDSLLSDTLYSVANSVNWDSIPSNLDKWNFGENFAIHIIDNPVHIENENSQPKVFTLDQNYPNPFNPSTNIRFSISDFGFVSLTVYDILGNEVAILVNDYLAAGNYDVEFSLESGIRKEATGIYLYQLKSGNFTQTKKMVLLK